MNLKYLLVSLIAMCLIIYASSIPGKPLWGNGSMAEQVISNLVHIPAYALLSFLWLKTFDKMRPRIQFLKVNALILTGLLLFAVSDEIHQSFIPGRTASYIDVGLDIAGIFLGLSTFTIFKAWACRYLARCRTAPSLGHNDRE